MFKFLWQGQIKKKNEVECDKTGKFSVFSFSCCVHFVGLLK